MNSNRTIEENLDEFLKMTLVLKGTDQELSDSSLAMILLNSLDNEYQVVKNALQYTSTIPSVDLIVAGLKARELELRVQKRSGNSLFVKGKGEISQVGSNPHHDSGSMNKKKGKNTNKSKGETRKYFYCNKTGHLKKNCLKWIRKQKQSNTKSNLATTKHSIEESEVLTVSKADTIGEWVLDSGCSIHMNPNKNWFQDFKQKL